MNSTLTGVAWAIVSALCLGTGTFLYKISSTSLGAANTTFFYYSFSMLLATGAWLFSSGTDSVNRSALIWPALMAFFLCASVWTFSTAVRTIDMSTASTIRSLSFLPAVLLAVLLYGERPGIETGVAILMIVGAVILLGSDAARDKAS